MRTLEEFGMEPEEVAAYMAEKDSSNHNEGVDEELKQIMDQWCKDMGFKRKKPKTSRCVVANSLRRSLRSGKLVASPTLCSVRTSPHLGAKRLGSVL